MVDPADPRLADYRDIQERKLNEIGGRFIAESELVVRKLARSGLQVQSVLLTAPRLASLGDDLQGDYPVFVAPQEVLCEVAGFHFHRGCLAIGTRPGQVTLPAHARTVLVLEDLVDVDNVGALVRNAAAFGVDALLLSPRCADPYYRKAVRVSAGTVFTLPTIRTTEWPRPLIDLRDQRGFSLVAAVVDDAATALPDFHRADKVALVLGAEGPGLSGDTKRLCDERITIPMQRSPVVDSLNVATAGAVLLYHLTTGSR